MLAVPHYATLLGVRPGSPATWALPASYAAAAVIGLAWAPDPASPPPAGLRDDRAGRPRRHRAARPPRARDAALMIAAAVTRPAGRAGA